MQLAKDKYAEASARFTSPGSSKLAGIPAAAQPSTGEKQAFWLDRKQRSLPTKQSADTKWSGRLDHFPEAQQTRLSRHSRTQQRQPAAEAVLEMQARLQQLNAHAHVDGTPAALQGNVGRATPSETAAPSARAAAGLSPAASRAAPHAQAATLSEPSGTPLQRNKAASWSATNLPNQSPAASHAPAASLRPDTAENVLTEASSTSQQSLNGSAASIVAEASRMAAFKGDWKAFLQRHRRTSNPLLDSVSDELDLTFNQLPDVAAAGGLDWSGKARVASLPCGQVCTQGSLLALLSQRASHETSARLQRWRVSFCLS